MRLLSANQTLLVAGGVRCCAVLQVGATLLSTLIVTQGLWITSSCPTPRARDPSLHRPRASCSEPEFLLAAYVPVNPWSAPRRHGKPTNQKTSRTEGLAQTCRAVFHSRTSHRGLKSMTERRGRFRAPHKLNSFLFPLLSLLSVHICRHRALVPQHVRRHLVSSESVSQLKVSTAGLSSPVAVSLLLLISRAFPIEYRWALCVSIAFSSSDQRAPVGPDP